jgi:hypothetical protein
MVWAKKYGEDEWEGHSIDGYAPSFKKLKDIISAEKYLLSSDITPEYLKKMGRDHGFMLAMQNGIFNWREEYSKIHPEVIVEERGRHVYRGTDDIYMLKLRKEETIKKTGKDEMTKKLYTDLQKEWLNEPDKRNYRQILVFSHNRPEISDCIDDILKKLDFTIKKPDSYMDVKKFEYACEWLLQKEGFRAFIYPCIIVEKNFKDLNFTCVRDF